MTIKEKIKEIKKIEKICKETRKEYKVFAKLTDYKKIYKLTFKYDECLYVKNEEGKRVNHVINQGWYEINGNLETSYFIDAILSKIISLDVISLNKDRLIDYKKLSTGSKNKLFKKK